MKRELAVVFLNVAGPDLFAVEVERHQLAVAVKEPDQIAVGDRRRRSKVAHVVHLDADSGLALPECFAFGAIEANGLECARLLVHGTDEDTVAPDDRRGGRGSGQVGHPVHIFGFREPSGESVFGAGAVERRSAPLRPLFCRQSMRGGRDQSAQR